MPKTTARHGGGNILEPDYFVREAEKWDGIRSERSARRKETASEKKPSVGSTRKSAPTKARSSKTAPTAKSTAGGTDGPSDKLPPNPKGPVDE